MNNYFYFVVLCVTVIETYQEYAWPGVETPLWRDYQSGVTRRKRPATENVMIKPQKEPSAFGNRQSRCK